MEFDKFPKIPGLIKTYQEGYVLPGDYTITIKMDGANAGIIKQDNSLQVHSRNTFLGTIHSPIEDLTSWNTLSGFAGFVAERYDWFINNMLDGQHLFAEWLVPHTISYPNEMYKKLYVFDDEFNGVLNANLGICKVPYLDKFTIKGYEDAHELHATLLKLTESYVNTTRAYHKTEGIVLRNVSVNERYKVVFDEFKEDNRVKFSSKTFDASKNVEVEMASKYPMRAYDKTLEKVKTLKSLEQLTKREIPAILGVSWHDYFTEFLHDICKDTHYPTVNFKVLKTEFENRIRTIFITEVDTGIRPVWASDD